MSPSRPDGDSQVDFSSRMNRNQFNLDKLRKSQMAKFNSAALDQNQPLAGTESAKTTSRTKINKQADSSRRYNNSQLVINPELD